MDLERRPALGLELGGFIGVGLLRGEAGRARVGGHTVAIRAEEAVDRLPGDLARDVPEGDVHRADRAVRGRAIALPQPLIEALALEGVLTHHDGLEELDQGLAVEVGAALRRAQERVALDAVVRLDREQAEVALAAEAAGVPSVGRGGNIGPGEEGERDVGDLHSRTPFSIVSGLFIARSDAATARRRRARRPRARARRPSRPRRRIRRATTRDAASRTAA